MSQKYLKELVQFAQAEIPLLKYDFQNASTHMTLQAATVRLFNLTTYMLHNLIHSAYENLEVTTSGQSAQPIAPPAPPPRPVVAATPHGRMPNLPNPTMIEQPSPAPEQLPNMNEVSVQPGVTNVVITPHGTRVIAPSGATAVLPPGEAVGLDATTGRPEVPPAPPGVDNVVLPPGGAFTPELAAALSSR
jgi:hypothetical protein